MTRGEALELVRVIQLTAAKVRSDLAETVEGVAGAEVVLASLQPYLFGRELNLVIITGKLLDKGDQLEPIDLYNLLVLVEKTPAIALGLQLLWRRDLPRPTVQWLQRLISDWEVTR